jgi:ATP-dependent exoDNAse (exonuclease V) beta subunit
VDFDQDQQNAINASGNTVVSAGAGSGKTTVLAERYLTLVRDHGVPVRNILTLTFTRKSSFEMRERIYRRLRAESEHSLVREQLAQFDEAQISTLDSFCSQIVREAGSAFGVPPDFTLDEEENRELAEEIGLRFLLEHADEPILVRLIAVNGFGTTWRELLAALVTDVLSPARSRGFRGLVDQQMRFLKERLVTLCHQLQERAEAFLAFEPGNSGSIRSRQERVAAFDFVPLKRGAEAVLETADSPKHPAGGQEETLNEMRQALSVLAGLDKRLGGQKRDDLEEIKATIDGVRERAHEAEIVVQSLLMEDDFRRLFDLLASFEERALAEKRTRGVFTHRDIIELAIRILSERDEVRRHWANRFQEVMIDEFQDNNEEQKTLLYLLCSPELDQAPQQKLFFVGDDKQSIYRFRGADVSVFNTLSTELRTQGGHHIRLDNNYRSDPRLIDFFNNLFRTVLSGTGQSFEATFLPLQAQVPEQPSPPLIRIGVKEQGGSGSQENLVGSHEAEAYWVAQQIRRLVSEEGLQVRDRRGALRPLRYDDVALLMRSTSNQSNYEAMLRLFGIPYATQSVRSLFQEAPVYDIYNVLQLAVYPEDRAAYAALLRSPVCNLSDAGSSALLLSGEPPFAEASPEALGLDEDDRRRYESAREMYRDVCARVDREDPATLVRALWEEYGYRYWMMRRPGNHPHLEYIDYLSELCGLARHRTVTEVLDIIRANLGEYRRVGEIEVLQRSSEGVQIMTIHKAKGLEFPVVVLANAGNVGRREGPGSRPFYYSQEHGLTINMPVDASRDRYNYFFRIGQEEEKARELAEIRRVLYVALTRSQHHLVVSGVVHGGSSFGERDHLGMILQAAGFDPETGSADPERLSPHLKIESIPQVNRAAVLGGAGRASGSPMATAQAYRERAPVRRRYAPVEFTATALNAAAHGGEAPSEPADGAAPVGGTSLPELDTDPLLSDQGAENRFGTLCHWLIEQRLRGRPPASSSGSSPEGYLESFEVGPSDVPTYLLEGYSREQAARVLGDALRLVRQFLESHRGRAVAAAAAEGGVESELPLLLRREVGGERLIIRGTADLVTADEASVRLFDFKTDRVAVPGHYHVQLALYAEALQELYRRPVTAMPIYLRDPDFAAEAIPYPCSDEVVAAAVAACRRSLEA